MDDGVATSAVADFWRGAFTEEPTDIGLHLCLLWFFPERPERECEWMGGCGGAGLQAKGQRGGCLGEAARCRDAEGGSASVQIRRREGGGVHQLQVP